MAKYHVCNYFVIGEKTFKNILIGPDNLPGLSRNGLLVWKRVPENKLFYNRVRIWRTKLQAPTKNSGESPSPLPQPARDAGQQTNKFLQAKQTFSSHFKVFTFLSSDRFFSCGVELFTFSYPTSWTTRKKGLCVAVRVAWPWWQWGKI